MEAHLRLAEIYSETEVFDKAEEEYHKVGRSFSPSFEFLVLGDLFIKKREFEKAEAEYKRVIERETEIERHPDLLNEIWAHFGLIEVYSIQKPSNTIEEYSNIVRLISHFTSQHFTPPYIASPLTLLYHGLRINNLINKNKELLLKDNNNPFAHFNLGLLYAINSLKKESLNELQKAHELAVKAGNSELVNLIERAEKEIK